MGIKSNRDNQDDTISARIVIVSGSPGTGKTSISKILSENSVYNRSVHIHTDDFYQYIRKGYISPWRNDSGNQNESVIEAVAASAKRFYKGGYEVFVDGVIGPWFLEPWIKIADEGVDVRYIILRPNVQTTVSRAAKREQREFFPLDDKITSELWYSLADLGSYELHAIDTTTLTIDESVILVQKMLSEGSFRII